MDEDSPISRLLMEGNWDMDVEGELPYDTTFRWRDQHGDTWVFQSASFVYRVLWSFRLTFPSYSSLPSPNQEIGFHLAPTTPYQM